MLKHGQRNNRLVAISGAIIYADSRDDLGRAKSDFESLRSRHDTSKPGETCGVTCKSLTNAHHRSITPNATSWS